MSSFLSEVGAGSWPDWAAAIGTTAAFLVAALAYRQSIFLRKESQARLVYAKITHIADFAPGETVDPLPNDAQIGNGSTALLYQHDASGITTPIAVKPAIQVTLKVHNGSDELISPIKIQMVDLGSRRVLDDTCIVTNGPVEPGTDYIVAFTIENNHYPGSPSIGVKILFRDATGRWWSRYQADPVEEVHDDPENYTYTPTERKLMAANARSMGLTPSPEPKLSWPVRLQRFKRRVRGKRPIP